MALTSVGLRLLEPFGVEAELRAPANLERNTLRTLVEEHALVLIRDFPLAPRQQLRLSGALGRLVGGPESILLGAWPLPELRNESSARHPVTGRSRLDRYSHHWHMDLSWAARPSDLSMLRATVAADGAPATGFADTRAGYAALAPGERARIAQWHAYHHVDLSRQMRHGATAPATRHPRARGLGRELRGWRTAARQAWLARTALPAVVAAPGAQHAVVRGVGDRPSVYLGDHAWRLDGFEEAEGLTAIDNLNRAVTCDAFVYRHTWRRGDLLIIDNRVLMHRRELAGDLAMPRVLRRSMVWLAGSG